jgi:hypothetical protein
MAIGRVSGQMLLPNLERDGVDLALETDLLYFDVTNRRIGIRTYLPGVTFTGELLGTQLKETSTPTPKPIVVGMNILAGVGVTGVLANTKIVSAGATPGTWVISQTYPAPGVTGALIGRMAPNFNFVVGANTRITDTTDSISCETGALVVDGGVGVGKNLNVCGDIFIKGVKVPAALEGAKRKTYSFNIPALAVGAVHTHIATLGYANMLYNLTVTAPVRVEAHTTPAMDDENPYTFLATTLHQTDDGTVYFTDGTRLRTRQYSILANLETPATKNIYFKITGIGDVFGGAPLSDLAPASFLGYISGTTLTVVGSVTGRMYKGMTVTSTTAGLVAANTVLTQFVGSTWELNVSYSGGIGSVTVPVVITARYSAGLSPLSVSFYGYITGSTLVVTTGLSTSLVPGMVLLSTDNSVIIFSNTRISTALGSIWTVSQSQTVGTAADPELLQSQALINTLEMIYIDEISDSGNMSVNVVSVLPLTGFTGETAFRTSDKTYWIYESGIWNQIQ